MISVTSMKPGDRSPNAVYILGGAFITLALMGLIAQGIKKNR